MGIRLKNLKYMNSEKQVSKMSVTLTCPSCGSAVPVYPSLTSNKAKCDICSHIINLNFDANQEMGILEVCPCCGRKDFYRQKDFNRKMGVILFIIASILSIWTYGISFIVLYALDLFLFQKLDYVAVCYKCNTIFRKAKNLSKIPFFDHEKNDRIVYAGHDFHGN